MTNATIVLGITGSIGMGKTTTAEMFRAEGIPVWDADKAVSEAYSPGGSAIEKIKEWCPSVIDYSDLGIDRNALREYLDSDPSRLEDLESIVHPIVERDREQFLAKAKARKERLVVVDIPLLFEVQAENSVDAVLVVTAPESVQRRRVLEREHMTDRRLDRILTRQMPDSEKKARADYVIETTTLEEARSSVRSLIEQLLHSRKYD